MNCTSVRSSLAEHALGSLGLRDAASVERHLAWCAACRKEARELAQASATLAYAVTPQTPPADLADRVSEAVHAEITRQDRRPVQHPRRSRLAIVAAVTATFAVLSLGWGTVMAGKAARSDDAVLREKIRSQSAVERFQDVLNWAEFGDPQDQVFLGTLSPSAPGGGGGSALTLVSPSIIDMAIVQLNGVPPETGERLPFTVRLRSDDGVALVDRIDKGELDDSGAAIVTGEFADLAGYDTVIVRDASGAVVMSGSMTTQASVASPTP
jgi:hypothetical protein